MKYYQKIGIERGDAKPDSTGAIDMAFQRRPVNNGTIEQQSVIEELSDEEVERPMTWTPNEPVQILYSEKPKDHIDRFYYHKFD